MNDIKSKQDKPAANGEACPLDTLVICTEHPRIELYNEDWRDLLPHYEDNWFDLAIEYSCYYCGKPATCFCDAVDYYEGTMVDGVPRISMENPDDVHFCERPICEEHSATIGMSTASGRVDTIDYCKKHMTMEKLGESPKIVCE